MYLYDRIWWQPQIINMRGWRFSCPIVIDEIAPLANFHTSVLIYLTRFELNIKNPAILYVTRPYFEPFPPSNPGMPQECNNM